MVTTSSFHVIILSKIEKKNFHPPNQIIVFIYPWLSLWLPLSLLRSQLIVSLSQPLPQCHCDCSYFFHCHCHFWCHSQINVINTVNVTSMSLSLWYVCKWHVTVTHTITIITTDAYTHEHTFTTVETVHYRGKMSTELVKLTENQIRSIDNFRTSLIWLHIV